MTSRQQQNLYFKYLITKSMMADILSENHKNTYKIEWLFWCPNVGLLSQGLTRGILTSFRFGGLKLYINMFGKIP